VSRRVSETVSSRSRRSSRRREPGCWTQRAQRAAGLLAGSPWWTTESGRNRKGVGARAVSNAAAHVSRLHHLLGLLSYGFPPASFGYGYRPSKVTSHRH
jgi:hypothetical protein